jgi:hypothetical protein
LRKYEFFVRRDFALRFSTLSVAPQYVWARPGIGEESPECGGDAKYDLLVDANKRMWGCWRLREKGVGGLGT